MTARKRPWLSSLALATLLALASEVLVISLPPLTAAEYWTEDFRRAAQPPLESQIDEIVTVLITEETLASFLYRSPVDREFLSDLLTDIEQKGARALGLDILLIHPTERSKDEQLAKTLRELTIPVIVGWADQWDGLTERQITFLNHYAGQLTRGLARVPKDDTDDTVRLLLIRDESDGGVELGFSAAIANTLQIDLPVEPLSRLYYASRTRHGTEAFASYPAHIVESLPAAWFQDKIVLVGGDLLLSDRHRVPPDVVTDPDQPSVPGVLIHAHGLAQLLKGYREPVIALETALGLTLGLALLGTLITLWHAWVGLRVTLLLVVIVGYAYATLVANQQTGAFFPVIPPLLALGLTAAVTSLRMWRRDHDEREFVQQAFAQFVPPAIVERLVSDPSQLKLSGERRQLSFVFTDVAGFTTLTEKTEPEAMVALLNEYLDGAFRIVFDHGGTLDKIVGDSVNVLFNAPTDQPDHATRAISCALALNDFCEDFSARKAQSGVRFGHTRIGVHTGDVIVGNVGGETHFEYSAVGDAVNTAARLESVNRHLGTRICISKATADLCDGWRFRPVASLVLKGKSEAIETFEPWLATGVDANRRLTLYFAAFELLSAGSPDAKAAFATLAKSYPDDPAYPVSRRPRQRRSVRRGNHHGRKVKRVTDGVPKRSLASTKNPQASVGRMK